MTGPRIAAVAAEVMARPWEWGAADCSTSACEVFAHLHGVDPMADLRGTYASRQGALRVIARFGGFEAMAETLAARAALVEIAPEGRAGALGLAPVGEIGALAICAARGVWLGKTQSGFATLRPQDVRRAWHVR